MTARFISRLAFIVSTLLFELEIRTADVEAWYRNAGPARLVNYGVAVGHISARMQVLGDKGFMLPTGPGRGPATQAQVTAIANLIDAGASRRCRRGGNGVGVYARGIG